MTKAIVFAYHSVGVRCLKALLAGGVDVALVVTHQDSPTETIWFDSVAATAARYGIPTVTPLDPNAPETLMRIAAVAPEFIFSFYYRQMLKPSLLQLAKRGAYNMHGSLLPKYRGRVPINWAVLHGETETGATLHRMVAKPDAGDIVAQQAVPILPDDTAGEVFAKVAVAAEMALVGALPALLAGTAEHRPQDLAQGSYFGGRKPEDGQIDWAQSSIAIHNLIRAVAPPIPGRSSTSRAIASSSAPRCGGRRCARAAPRPSSTSRTIAFSPTAAMAAYCSCSTRSSTASPSSTPSSAHVCATTPFS
ncbi:formyltransferase [Sulfurisoma sediminicola]|uniref:formyltransferase n=1 Tax=Sulfurisoma sediminicola TaxID=1381557 RepID=UPI001A9F0936|nr:formyltransferase [Sulfurisoma sediminicola]